MLAQLTGFDMETIYFGSAVIGGALLVIQLVLSIFTGGADADFDVDVDIDADLDGAEGAGGISFRTVVAFITFFGIAGMGCSQAGVGRFLTLLAAVGAGGSAFWLTGLMMAQLYRMQSSGTVRIQNAVGAEGKVYLKVPGRKKGAGKVTIPIQGRTMEYRAITAGSELPTGALCRITAVHPPSTLEVEALD